MGYCTWFSKVWRFPPNPLPQGLKPLLTLNPLSQLLAGTVQVGAVRAPGGGGGGNLLYIGRCAKRLQQLQVDSFRMYQHMVVALVLLWASFLQFCRIFTPYSAPRPEVAGLRLRPVD
jgi:hypothetical protein